MLARTISTAIFVSVIVYSLFNPSYNWIVKILGFIITIFGTIEAVTLAKKIKLKPYYIVAVISSLLIFIDGVYFGFGNFVAIVFLTILLPFIIQMLFLREQNAISNISTSVFASFYVSIPVSLFFYIFNKIEEKSTASALLLFLLVVVWMTDTGAYLVGSSIGKRKMAPKLSPKKTIEGMIGGFIGAVLTGLIFYFSFISLKTFFSSGVFEVIIVSLVLAFFCQIGDLAESALKRDAGVKDSGVTYTGHGGILDMVDGLLFCIPVFYIYLRCFYPMINF